jgi:AraC-like DNA-binding protein
MAVPYPDPWPTPAGFTLASVATSIESPNTTYGPWVTDAYGIAWVVEGGGTTHYDEEAIQTSTGSVLCVKPGMRAQHDWGATRSTQAFFGFYLDGVAPPWPDPKSWPVHRNLPEGHVFFSLFRSLLGFDFKNKETHPFAVPLAELLVRLFVSGFAAQDAQVNVVLPDAVEKALAYIKAHVSRDALAPLSLQEVSDHVHVTRQHLGRLFKSHVGLSPIECANALRLERAASQIERSERPLARIAEEHGFSSQFHFSKVFKKTYGMSPNAYRKAFRTGVTARPPGLVFRNHPLRNYFYEESPGKILKPQD